MKNLILVGILLYSLSLSAGGYKVGDRAVDFSLKNVDGKMVSMKEMKDTKGFIVVFTCNHCPFSQVYESRILELDKKYSAKGFPVIAINPNDVTVVPEDSYENMVEVAKEKHYTFPYLYDESQAVASAYGATRTPHVFVVNKEKNEYVVRYIGAIDNNSEDPKMASEKYVSNAVNALLDGKPVPVQETKAIGCTIKWKK